jgi:hypothetical protein
VSSEIHSGNRVAPSENHLHLHKKILGMRPVIFWVMLALVVIVVGGAVGGGVGGSLANNSKKATSSVATTTDNCKVRRPWLSQPVNEILGGCGFE